MDPGIEFGIACEFVTSEETEESEDEKGIELSGCVFRVVT